MAWHLTDDIDEFLAGAGDFLRARPVHNTVLLTLLDSLRRTGGDQVFGWCGDGAFLRRPPRGAVLTDMPPAAAAELAVSLAGTDLPGVTAPDPVTEAFAAEWLRLTGTTPRVTSRNRLYSLTTLTPPEPPVPGSARVAEAADRDLLVDWAAAYSRDMGEDHTYVADFVDEKLPFGGLRIWETAAGPVSMAANTRMESGMVRVQMVFTPREHRARGYAGAVTTAVARAALDAGATDVVLFTDLANPTSNALYQRLGFTPVDDRSTVEFAA